MSTKTLTTVIETINKTYGKKTIHFGNEAEFLQIDRIPTGIFSLDLESGGGIPRSRLIHVYGAESVGKTELCLRIAAQAQKRCNWCSALLARCVCGAKEPMAVALVDIEKSDDALWRHKHGVDPNLFLTVLPNNAPQAVDITTELQATGEFGIIIFDSVAAMIPPDAIEKSAEAGMQPGTVARMMSLATKKWQAIWNTHMIHPVSKKPWPNRTTIICINQLRESIGPYAKAPAPPGGRALKHAAALGIMLSKANSDYKMVEHEDGEKSAVNQTVHFFIEKNKTYAPRRSGKYVLDFTTVGVDNMRQIFEYGLRFEVITKENNTYSHGDVSAVGRDKAYAAFSDTGEMKNIEREVRQMLKDEMTANYKAAGVTLKESPADDAVVAQEKKRIGKVIAKVVKATEDGLAELSKGPAKKATKKATKKVATKKKR